MTQVKWKLRELMARHKITNVQLAEYLGISKTAMSDLRRADTLPRIDGDRLISIAKGLSELSGEETTIFDLMEVTE
jgi:DNA-binding Xre family transcriptional regulator